MDRSTIGSNYLIMTENTKERSRRSIGDRLINKVKIDERGCWMWHGAMLKKPHGNYGMIWIGSAKEGKRCRAHRISYEWFVGPIPEGLELDHLCRNTLCINPEHLEPVTHTENMRRRLDVNKSHCEHGHELSEGNLYVNPRGARECKICMKNRTVEFYKRKRANQTSSSRIGYN